MKPALLIVFIATLAQAQWDKLRAAMEAETARVKLPALSLAISDAERTVFQAHTGAANEKTIYRAGSITKLMTAIAIVQLADAGKLDLDAPVRKYLPELHFGADVTPRRMLSHRSGIVREPGRGHYFDDHAASLREVTASVAETEPVYRPGTETKYSNAAFSLLGDIVERVSGQSYEAYVREHIWTPIGMTDTYLRKDSVPVGRLAKASMWTLDGREFPAPVFDLGTASAGNLLTTCEDLLRFARWLMREDPRPILGRASLDAMQKAQDGGTRFGIGFALDRWDQEAVFGHGGAVYGYTALLEILPAKHWAGVVLAARDGVDFVTGPLLHYAANPVGEYQRKAIPNARRLEENGPVKPAPPPAAIARQVGEYGWDFNKLYVFERGGKVDCLIEWFYWCGLEPSGAGRYRFPAQSLYAGEEVRIEATGLWVGNVWFPRLPEPDRNFRVELQKPLPELRRIAAASTPPAQPKGLRKPDLVNLKTLSPTIHFDIRYATGNNFMGTAMYSRAEALFQRPAAEALLAAHRWLGTRGYGLLIHDSYRPWKVTKMFWEATPERQRNFVANPATGSRHNRGCAVDLSMYELETGKPVETVSGYDEMSDRAYPEYPGGTASQRWLRGLLRKAMEDRGFKVNEDEWWHFDFRDWQKYPVMDLSFEQLGSR